LAALGVTLLNPIVIGKWEAHKVISDNPALKPYLPDTKLLTKFEQVDPMVRNYQAVYLKPITGSKGQNIIRIARHKRAVGYHYQYEKNKRSVQGYANNIQQLHSALRPVMGGRQYIAQRQ
jgi:glutathionylspermidine synthase